MLNDKQIQNIRDILGRFAQRTHLMNFKAWGISASSKSEMIEKLINRLILEEDKIQEFNKWFNEFFRNRANNYYIFDIEIKDKKQLEEEIKNIKQDNLLDIGVDELNTSKCLQKEINEDKTVLRFVINARIQKREENGLGQIDYVEDDIMYFYSVIIDYTLKQLIVSIPHTTGLELVFNRYINRGDFNSVVKHIQDDMKNYLTNIEYSSCKKWIYTGLYTLAEEGSAHNNPEITNKCLEKEEDIIQFSNKLLEEIGINDEGLADNLIIGIQDLLENILIDKLGVCEASEYQLFKQNGDRVNSFFSVGTKTSSLQRGREAAIAKTVRQFADITTLGITRKVEEDNQKYIVQVDSIDGIYFYLIKSDTSKYIEEEVIYNVIQKVGSYKDID